MTLHDFKERSKVFGEQTALNLKSKKQAKVILLILERESAGGQRL